MKALQTIGLICFLELASADCFSQNPSTYQAIIEKADSAYAIRRWSLQNNLADTARLLIAKELYTKASLADATKEYPIDRVREIDFLIKQLEHQTKEKEHATRVDSLLLLADNHFEEHDYENALKHYKQAGTLYVSLKYYEYIKQRVLLCEDAITIGKPNANKFVNAVSIADMKYYTYLSGLERDAVEIEELEQAIVLYKEALQIFKDSKSINMEEIEQVHIRALEIKDGFLNQMEKELERLEKEGKE